MSADRTEITPEQQLQAVLDELDEWAASYPGEAAEWLSTVPAPSEISIEIAGATAVEIERGIEAAQAVFRAANVSAEEADLAVHAFEGWDLNGFSADTEPTRFEGIIMPLWQIAESFAINASCAGWSPERLPSNSVMDLVEEDEKSSPSPAQLH